MLIFDHGTFGLSKADFMWPSIDEATYTGPLEKIGAKLVRELARVGWEIPGIDIEIGTHGRGGNLIRAVRKVSGMTEDGPFELRFDSPQGQKGSFYVTTGLSEATIPPGVEIVFYNDKSGPVAHLYLGKDWKKDGPAWMADAKVNSKLDGKPMTYLKYSGRGNSGVMSHDNDMGREFSPKGSQPKSLDSAKVARDVTKFVEKLIAKLSKMPTAPGSEDVGPHGDANLVRLAEVARVPAPADFPVLYSWVDRNDAYRLRRLAGAEVEDQFGLHGNGWRLCSMGSKSGKLPERATDGFSYASTDPATRAGHVVHGAREDSSPVVVKLKWLNDVFVVDNSAFERARDEMANKAKSEGRDRITNLELDECIAATARTMVPVGEYDGSFEDPVYLIGRQTGVDEVRMVHGAVEMSQTDGRTQVVVKDAETDIGFVMFDRDGVGPRAVASASREAEQVALLHGNGRFRNSVPKIDPADQEPDTLQAFRL